MKCRNCNRDGIVGGYIILDSGVKWRIYYCFKCECIQRIGRSVPDVKASYKGSYVKMYKHKGEGGD